ncbi:hypothetical protein [Arthrobacter nitrophenolicus]|uniref:hypothetical protein n=1 Tax=Arthrobacter nitrophenolicus TaxID=683150 RepID=UPI001F433A63|nr:hypothetical protein [Arthrobacter nitrophenolicus]
MLDQNQNYNVGEIVPATPATEESAATRAPLRPDAFRVPYRDPVWDGPTDPVLVADHLKGEWVLFYTQRRATKAGLTGVEWVHGTGIGVARSPDGGATWTYQAPRKASCRREPDSRQPSGRPTSSALAASGSCT